MPQLKYAKALASTFGNHSPQQRSTLNKKPLPAYWKYNTDLRWKTKYKNTNAQGTTSTPHTLHNAEIAKENNLKQKLRQSQTQETKERKTSTRLSERKEGPGRGQTRPLRT